MPDGSGTLGTVTTTIGGVTALPTISGNKVTVSYDSVLDAGKDIKILVDCQEDSSKTATDTYTIPV